MVDRDDLAFFAKAMTPSKATTQAGWTRLQAAIEAAETTAEEELGSEPVAISRRSRLAIWGGASLLAAAAIVVLALGIGRERGSLVAEESDRSQAVDAREGGATEPLETKPVERARTPARDGIAAPRRASAPSPAREDESIAAPVPTPRVAATATTPTRRPTRASSPPRSDATTSRVAEPAAPAPAPIPAPQARPIEVPDTLALEATSLRRVERALASGQLARARSLLRAHRQQFPRGLLAREASLLQVVIACEAGDADTAATAARDHTVAFPDDPTTIRLRKQICSK